MKRSGLSIAAALGGSAAVWACSAAAETAYAAESTSGSFLKLLTERLEIHGQADPGVWAGIWRTCPTSSAAGPRFCCWVIVVAGLAVEYTIRLLLNRARLRGFDRLGRPVTAARHWPRHSARPGPPWSGL